MDQITSKRILKYMDEITDKVKNFLISDHTLNAKIELTSKFHDRVLFLSNMSIASSSLGKGLEGSPCSSLQYIPQRQTQTENIKESTIYMKPGPWRWLVITSNKKVTIDLKRTLQKTKEQVRKIINSLHRHSW